MAARLASARPSSSMTPGGRHRHLHAQRAAAVRRASPGRRVLAAGPAQRPAGSAAPAGRLGANLGGRRVHLGQGPRAVGARQAHAAVRLGPTRSTRCRARRPVRDGCTRGRGRTGRPGGCGPGDFPAGGTPSSKTKPPGHPRSCSPPNWAGAGHHAGQGIADPDPARPERHGRGGRPSRSRGDPLPLSGLPRKQRVTSSRIPSG